MLYVALIVLTSILFLILIAVIFWRMFSKHAKKEQVIRQFVTSQKTLEIYDFFAKVNGLQMFVNILFKNKYSKSGNSLLPGLIISNKKIYILSEIIFSKKEEKIVIDEQKYKNLWILTKNKKLKKIDNISFQWIKEIDKFFKNNKVNFEILLIINDSESLIENKTNQKVLSLEKLLLKMQFDEQNIVNYIDQNKWLKYFKNNNYFKSK